MKLEVVDKENYIRCEDLVKFIMNHPNFKLHGDYQEVISDLLLFCDTDLQSCLLCKSLNMKTKVIKND